jgi:negative regulator of sigma E activity
MAKMSDEMIIGMIQQHLDCLQRFIKADELSVSDWKLMADHAWKIEWLCQAFAEQKKKEDKN